MNETSRYGGACRSDHGLGGVDEPFHGLDRGVEEFLLLGLELDLDDALDPAGADHDRQRT